MPSAPISAVIPNRDGADLLRRTLPPLLRELPPPENEVVVIDDASTDGSVEMLREEFSTVRVVSLRESVGFGAACNLGVREANHPLVLLLNSDMEVTPESVKMLREHLHDSRVLAAGPWYLSAHPSPAGSAREPEGVRYQIGAPAGGGLFRREVFLELGGFDPLYSPFYWEDLDLGWNAWRRGWRIVLDNRCHFLHLESVTVRRLYSPAYVRRIRTRNRFLFGWKNLRSRSLLLPFLARATLRALADLLRRRDASGILGALASIPLIPKARHAGAQEGLIDLEVLQLSGEPLSNLLKL